MERKGRRRRKGEGEEQKDRGRSREGGTPNGRNFESYSDSHSGRASAAKKKEAITIGCGECMTSLQCHVVRSFSQAASLPLLVLLLLLLGSRCVV